MIVEHVLTGALKRHSSFRRRSPHAGVTFLGGHTECKSKGAALVTVLLAALGW